MSSTPRSALELLRAVGLMVDGPVLWGSPVPARDPGVFVVEAPSPLAQAPIDIVAVRAWLERAPGLRLDGQRPTPTALAARLAAFWLPRQTVLYTGRTAKALGGRVAALHATPLGHRRPHAGGHWLKALRGLDRLRVWWAATDAPEEYEDALLTLFAEGVSAEEAAGIPPGSPVLPFADLEAVTGEARPHGLSGALVDGASEPMPGPAPARPAGAAATPRAAPRRTAAPRTAAPRTGGRAPRAATTRPVAAAPPVHLSTDGLERVQAELRQLVGVQRPQVIARVAAARALGDLRENAEYQSAREEQSFLEGRIRTLEQMLRNAVVIEATGAPHVGLGSTVEVEHDDDRITYRIVGSTEADPAAGRISDASPVGRALIGHAAGEEVAIALPGRTVRYRIVEVR